MCSHAQCRAQVADDPEHGKYSLRPADILIAALVTSLSFEDNR
jgi:hypothetical protein